MTLTRKGVPQRIVARMPDRPPFFLHDDEPSDRAFSFIQLTDGTGIQVRGNETAIAAQVNSAKDRLITFVDLHGSAHAINPREVVRVYKIFPDGLPDHMRRR
jgi:hypothetical protein